MSLQSQLNEMSRKFSSADSPLGSDAVEVMKNFAAELKARNLEAQVPDAGAVIEDFTLPSAEGPDVSLWEELAQGPVALLVYRGMW